MNIKMEKDVICIVPREEKKDEKDALPSGFSTRESNSRQTMILEETVKQKAKKSVAWDRFHADSFMKDKQRYSDPRVSEKYLQNITSLAGVLPRNFSWCVFIWNVCLAFILPYFTSLLIFIIPACTPWSNDHDGFYDYVSPESCQTTDLSFYATNVITISLGTIPSTIVILQEFVFLRCFGRKIRFTEILIALASGTVGVVLSVFVLLQYWSYPPMFPILSICGAFPFLLVGFAYITFHASQEYPDVSRRKIWVRLLFSIIANSSAFFVTFGSYVGFSALYNYLQSRKDEFYGMTLIAWYLYELCGMTVVRSFNIYVFNFIYSYIDPSQNHVGYSSVLFIHFTFLSYLRASAGINGNYLGLLLLTLSDVWVLVLSVVQIAYNIDIVYQIKSLLCLTKEDEQDQGIDIVEYAIFLGLEEIAELLVITVYILLELTLWNLENKTLIAGTGISAFGLQKAENLKYIGSLLVMLAGELFTFAFAHMVLKWKCDLHLHTALMCSIHKNGYICYMATFSIVMQNVFRYVPFGCDLHFNFKWLLENN